MSLKIRLAKIGRKKKKIFRVVVVPTRSKRNGVSLETLGLYDLSGKTPKLKIDQAQLEEWQKKGAQISSGLRKILSQEQK